MFESVGLSNLHVENIEDDGTLEGGGGGMGQGMLTLLMLSKMPNCYVFSPSVPELGPDQSLARFNSKNINLLSFLLIAYRRYSTFRKITYLVDIFGILKATKEKARFPDPLGFRK